MAERKPPSPVVSIRYRFVTDRQTDRQTDVHMTTENITLAYSVARKNRRYMLISN